MNSAISFSNRVRVPDTVLVQAIQGEIMFLNLAREQYHALDQTSSHMWRVLNSSDCIETACTILQNEYEIEPQQLRHDLSAFIAELLDKGLLEICDG